jgi:hypothetical protein
MSRQRACYENYLERKARARLRWVALKRSRGHWMICRFEIGVRAHPGAVCGG